MNWDDLQKEAKTKGNLVFAMDQAQTPVMTQPGPWGTSTDGFCLGLAAQWMFYCYQKKTFPVDGSQVCESPPWQSTLSQSLAAVSVNKGWVDFWTASAAPFQMTVSDGLRATRNTPPTAAFLHSIVIMAYGCYGVTLQAADGSHAIALRHAPDNRMHLFDANYGHFSVRDHTLLKPFLAWYLKKSGYDTEYGESTHILGVRPPIVAK
jgi:Yersinia/Haemophilus virulence surface antigen